VLFLTLKIRDTDKMIGYVNTILYKKPEIYQWRLTMKTRIYEKHF